jgi:hypothetical protein
VRGSSDRVLAPLPSYDVALMGVSMLVSPVEVVLLVVWVLASTNDWDTSCLD